MVAKYVNLVVRKLFSMAEGKQAKMVLETDEDNPEDYGEEGGLYPYDPTKEDIDIREEPMTVFELIRKYDSGKLKIDPDFQRNLVWSIK